jgi:hypothetical protein
MRRTPSSPAAWPVSDGALRKDAKGSKRAGRRRACGTNQQIFCWLRVHGRARAALAGGVAGSPFAPSRSAPSLTGHAGALR